MRIIKVNNCNDCPYPCVIKNFPKPNDNCPIKSTEIENEVLVNNIELASNLSHQSTFDEMKDLYNEDELWVDDNGTKIYKDDVQEVFNRWYDYYRDEIDKCNLLD
jgi:hypothetical protein